MILVGTSGFSYRDWIGEFYPPGTKDPDMLPFYTQRFSVVELDFTYYTMPSARTMRGLEGKTPDGFAFCIKAHKSMTHEVDPDSIREVYRAFVEGISPVIEARKLGCILFQFPWGFRDTPENRDYVKSLPELAGGLPLVVEFRNQTWIQDQVFELLSRLGLGFCCVDEPGLRGLIPPIARATSGVAYVRFHGRNKEKWWKHEQAWERYNYLYSEEELKEWLPRIDRISREAEMSGGPEARVYVLFNNCHAGHAVRNALMFQAMLA